MDGDLEAALQRAERALDEGRSLRGTRFWKAVDACRRDRALGERFADRIGRIDRRAFEAGVRLRLPAWLGLALLLAATGVGLLLIAIAYGLEPLPQAIAVLVGTGVLLIGTHSPTHWIVGRAGGIRFTHVFLGGPPPPRPGLKTDYASYLRARPRARASMHASGAVVTKLVPFALIGAAQAMDAYMWLTWALAAVGVVQIVTDVLFSTKTSDWKKVLRELRAARAG